MKQVVCDRCETVQVGSDATLWARTTFIRTHVLSEVRSFDLCPTCYADTLLFCEGRGHVNDR